MRSLSAPHSRVSAQMGSSVTNCTDTERDLHSTPSIELNLYLRPPRPDRRVFSCVASGSWMDSRVCPVSSWVPRKARLCMSRLWRRLIVAGWPGDPKPFGGAEYSPIAFICEFEEQVGLALVLLSEGQFAISHRANVAHGISNPNANRGHTNGTDFKPAGSTRRVFFLTLIGVASR